MTKSEAQKHSIIASIGWRVRELNKNLSKLSDLKIKLNRNSHGKPDVVFNIKTKVFVEVDETGQYHDVCSIASLRLQGTGAKYWEEWEDCCGCIEVVLNNWSNYGLMAMIDLLEKWEKKIKEDKALTKELIENKKLQEKTI